MSGGNDEARKNTVTRHANTLQNFLEEGHKQDSGKVMLDLVPPSLEEAVGTILTFGAEKYGRNDWKKGFKYSRIVAALKRHLNEFYKGNVLDPESGKPHLWHAACNIAFLIEFESNPEKYKDFNDLVGD